MRVRHTCPLVVLFLSPGLSPGVCVLFGFSSVGPCADGRSVILSGPVSVTATVIITAPTGETSPTEMKCDWLFTLPW